MGSTYLYLSNFLYLTRISHELSAAAPDPSASAAFRFVGLLDVPSKAHLRAAVRSTPPAPSRRAPALDPARGTRRYAPGARNAP